MKRTPEAFKPWSMPPELMRSRPREVALTSGGVALRGFGFALVLSGIGLGIFLGIRSVKEHDDAGLLAEQAASTDARVTRLWEERGEEHRQAWITYEFQAAGQTWMAKRKVPEKMYRQLQGAAAIPVRYLGQNPGMNHPAAWPMKPLPYLVPWLVGSLLAGTGVMVAWSVNRSKALLENGRGARAVVIKVQNTGEGKWVRYEFETMNGRRQHGSSTGNRKLGTELTVVYDPENPRRNAPYPMHLVRVE